VTKIKITMIEIKEVLSHKDLKKFVKFPFELYKDCPYWVPPLIKDEMETLNPKLNPAFKNADAWFYLAYKNGKVVGRIGVMVNHLDIEILGNKKIRFGWLDMIDDIEVTRALLEKAFQKGKALGLEYVEGPMGFNNMEKAGILTKGFKEMNTMITWYHYPYYFEHMKQMRFERQATWIEFKMQVPPSIFEKITKFSNLIKERYSLKVIPIQNKEHIIDLADAMFELLNSTYSSLQTYVPLQPEQKEYYKKKYMNFLNPDYITCIKDKNDKLIAFSIVMPSFSKALKKANGKLFPFGWKYILDAQRKNDTAAFYLSELILNIKEKALPLLFLKKCYQCLSQKALKQLRLTRSLWKIVPFNLYGKTTILCNIKNEVLLKERLLVAIRYRN